MKFVLALFIFNERQRYPPKKTITIRDNKTSFMGQLSELRKTVAKFLMP